MVRIGMLLLKLLDLVTKGIDCFALEKIEIPPLRIVKRVALALIVKWTVVTAVVEIDPHTSVPPRERQHSTMSCNMSAIGCCEFST